MRFECIDKRGDAVILRTANLHNRHIATAPRAQRKGRRKFTRRALGRRQVAFGDDKHVRDLEDSCFQRLYFVARAGRYGDDDRIGRPNDRNFRLPGAYRFDEDDVVVACREQ